jgi:hypothetical protein
MFNLIYEAKENTSDSTTLSFPADANSTILSIMDRFM